MVAVKQQLCSSVKRHHLNIEGLELSGLVLVRLSDPQPEGSGFQP